MSLLARIALLLGLRLAPPVDLLRVHRGERELCAGTAFLGSSSTPVAKLSGEEALRCFGVVQGR